MIKRKRIMNKKYYKYKQKSKIIKPRILKN